MKLFSKLLSKLPWRKQPLPERARAVHAHLQENGVNENPEVLYLLYSELRSANNKFAYALGALSIIVALLTVHVFVPFGT